MFKLLIDVLRIITIVDPLLSLIFRHIKRIRDNRRNERRTQGPGESQLLKIRRDFPNLNLEYKMDNQRFEFLENADPKGHLPFLITIQFPSLTDEKSYQVTVTFKEWARQIRNFDPSRFNYFEGVEVVSSENIYSFISVLNSLVYRWAKVAHKLNNLKTK